MKSTALALLVGLSFLVLAPAHAARPAGPAGSQRPAQVLGEIGVAGLDGELMRWTEAIARLSPTTPAPKAEMIAGGLAKMIGAQSIEGLDLGRPITIVMLNPMGFPQPLVLVGQLANKKKLDESLAATPVLTARVKGKLVAIGSATALDHAAEYAFGRLRVAPAKGAHAVAFLEPILASFGGQLQMMKGVLMAQPQTPGSPVPTAALVGMFDGVMSGLTQSTELIMDVGIQAGVPEFSLGLTAKPGTAIDQFIANQKASDFSALGKIPARPANFVFAGKLALGETTTQLLDWVLGNNVDAASRAELVEMAKLMSGEIAGLGSLGNLASPEQMEITYLIGTTDAERALVLLPRAHAIISKSGMFGGIAQVKMTSLPATEYDGLKVTQSEFHYDFTKMPNYKGKPLVDLKAAWTGWDKLVALTIGGDAAKNIRSVVDAARHATGAFVPSGALRSSLDRARAMKESFWMRMEMAALIAAQGKAMQGKEPLPAWVVPAVGMGVSGHTVHMRVTIADPH